MWHHLQSALVLGLASLATAIFQDEVGDVDFHHSLVGIPQVDTTFFHRPRRLDKASLLYTLSDLGVVGAVNPGTGEVVWRQQLSEHLTNGGGFLRAPSSENWVAAAQGGNVQAWNAQTGRSVWQTQFAGEVKDLEILELTEDSRKDVLVLSDEDGTTVLRRIHGGQGTVVWEFRETSKDIPLQVSNNIANIFVLSLHGSMTSSSVKTTSLDTATGQRVDHWSTKGDLQGADDIMFVGANSAAPIVAWSNSDNSKISVQVIGTKSKQDFALPADTISVHVHAPHQTQSLPHFLVHAVTKTGNKAEVFHVDVQSSQITKSYELPHLAGHGSFSTSSEDANVYFTRVTEDEVYVVSSESHAILARWPVKLEGGIHGVHSVSEIVRKAGSSELAVRAAVVTDSQDWVMIRNGKEDWKRVEGLSGAVAAAWAEIPESETLAKVLAEEAHTNPVSAYVHRVTRHIHDLQHLPSFLLSLPTKISASLLGGESTGTQASSGLHADVFGFNQIIVLATRRGRFYGLNTGNNGEVVWSRSVLPQINGELLDVKGFAVQDDGSTIAMRGSKGEAVLIRATDGHVIDLQLSGSPVASVAVVEDEAKAYLLPFDSEGVPAIQGLESVSNQTFVVRSADTVKGVKLAKVGDKIAKRDIWQLQALPNQHIVDVASLPAHDSIASIGRVLGDRRVSYKYINPNTIVVALVEDAASTLTVQLVDSVSGQVLASQKYDGVDASKPISCTMSENWYACAFFGQYTLADDGKQSIKGYQIAVTDLYESPTPNDRGPLGDADKFSPLDPIDSPTAETPLPWVVSQTWIVSQPLTGLSVTQTRQGIANRQIVAYLPEAHSVLCLPRMIVDPRRPVGRDPSAAEMEAEGLPRYTPAIEIDSRAIVSHEWDVIGVQGFVASPAVIESTSLLVAYGIDVYGTRVSPSGLFDILGKGFNKLTVVGTVLALFAGVFFLAPMVRKQQINTRWRAFL